MKLNQLLKVLVSAPVAAGSVCLTMKLTNQANTSLLDVGGLDLEDLPQPKENELKPKQPPVKPAPAQPSGSGRGEDSQTGNPQGDKDSNSQSSSQEPSGASSAVLSKEVEDLLIESMNEIKTKANFWLTVGAGTFATGYEVVNRLTTLTGLLKQFEQKQKDKQKAEAGASGSGSQGQGAGSAVATPVEGGAEASPGAGAG